MKRDYKNSFVEYVIYENANMISEMSKMTKVFKMCNIFIAPHLRYRSLNALSWKNDRND